MVNRLILMMFILWGEFVHCNRRIFSQNKYSTVVKHSSLPLISESETTNVPLLLGIMYVWIL
jgi:hypothetical protein